MGCVVIFIKNILFSVSEKNGGAFCGTRDQPTFLSELATKGKSLFQVNCASCHSLFKDMTGPGLLGFEDRGSWSDRSKLYEWIKNPGAFMKKNKYTRELKTKYGSVMTAFPDLTENEIDAIVEYINQSGNVQYLPIAKE